MRHHLFPVTTVAVAAALACGAAAAQNAATDESLKPYLVEIAPGPQSAYEMLGLAHTVVTSLQSPKDWMGVIGASDRNDAKGGFGFTFTPGRSDIRALAVSARAYATSDHWVHRLWGATTLSYAQNQAEYGGADYRQQAFFAQTLYYLTPGQDPQVAAFEGVAKCVQAKEQAEAFNTQMLQRLAAARAEARARNPQLGAEAIETLMEQLEDKATQEMEAERAAAAEAPMSFMPRAIAATRACAQTAMDTAAANWRATRVGLAIGQGWITGSAAGSQRLSLGQHLSLSGVWGPPGMDRSLLQLTVRHSRREVDLQTLAGTPSYRSDTQAAVRFTYDAGGARKVYMLAEVSTARADAVTQSSTAFRQALGLDYQIADGTWLELRHGRLRSSDGNGTEAKSLLTLKFSGAVGGLPKLLGS